MKFFSLENPIWKFIGNLADFFLLSCLWYLCCLPVVTAGAATTALYYVTLKMARGQEGQLIPAFSILLSRTSSRQPRCGWGTWRLASCWYWIW